MTKSERTSDIYPKDVDQLLKIKDLPVVAINQQSLCTFVNKAFEKEFGWTAKELINTYVGRIMPPHLRDAHKIGISRFLATEKPTLLGHRLELEVLYRSGKISGAEHYIIGDKKEGEWRFAAIIKPKPLDA